MNVEPVTTYGSLVSILLKLKYMFLGITILLEQKGNLLFSNLQFDLQPGNLIQSTNGMTTSTVPANGANFATWRSKIPMAGANAAEVQLRMESASMSITFNHATNGLTYRSRWITCRYFARTAIPAKAHGIPRTGERNA